MMMLPLFPRYLLASSHSTGNIDECLVAACEPTNYITHSATGDQVRIYLKSTDQISIWLAKRREYDQDDLNISGVAGA
jgi:hypothetical protein